MAKNINLEHIGQIRLEIITANGARSNPEFKPTVGEARRRWKELTSAGYSVSLFSITETGQLLPVRP